MIDMTVMTVMTVNAKSVNREKRVRQTRTGRPLQFYAGDEFIAALDRWRGQQADVPGRSEAIRRLCERGLAADRVDAQVEANRAAAPKRRNTK
jgi:hypothetical protein